MGKIDKKLEEAMEGLREIVELGHSFRKTAGIPLRQPLAKLSVLGSKEDWSKDMIPVLADELNVKEVEFCPGKELKVEFDTVLTSELKAERAARELVRAIQNLRREENLKLTDRIKVGYPVTGENRAAVALFSQMIRQQTLAIGLEPDKILKIWKTRK
jgi:isoleucyl-tRNA synthetase